MHLSKNDRITQFTNLMNEGLEDEDFVKDIMLKLDSMGFFEAPASTKYHGNYPGGLFDHSFMVTKSLVELTERLNLHWNCKRSPYLVGMLHDICKCDNYIQKEDGTYEYAKNLPLCGHGDKSTILALTFVELTDEEMMCIRWHMGAYEKDTALWNNLGAAIEKYPNVLYTHTADMIASRVVGI